jgi:hypothetical protein
MVENLQGVRLRDCSRRSGDLLTYIIVYSNTCLHKEHSDSAIPQNSKV